LVYYWCMEDIGLLPFIVNLEAASQTISLWADALT
jgi:hypothetical protein